MTVNALVRSKMPFAGIQYTRIYPKNRAIIVFNRLKIL